MKAMLINRIGVTRLIEVWPPIPKFINMAEINGPDKILDPKQMMVEERLEAKTIRFDLRTVQKDFPAFGSEDIAVYQEQVLPPMAPDIPLDIISQAKADTALLRKLTELEKRVAAQEQELINAHVRLSFQDAHRAGGCHSDKKKFNVPPASPPKKRLMVSAEVVDLRETITKEK